jgi:hypothetical protein
VQLERDPLLLTAFFFFFFFFFFVIFNNDVRSRPSSHANVGHGRVKMWSRLARCRDNVKGLRVA